LLGNSTLLDEITSDFMAAVCGDRAAEGFCMHSVASLLSTIPGWIYVDGANSSEIPENPWEYPDGDMSYYSRGSLLHD
jgi:hypothetical protein